MADPNIIDPFHRALYNRLEAEIAKRMGNLAAGSATRTTENDPVSTAEKYAAQCAHITALYSVLDLCKELEAERYGPAPGQEQQQQQG